MSLTPFAEMFSGFSNSRAKVRVPFPISLPMTENCTGFLPWLYRTIWKEDSFICEMISLAPSEAQTLTLTCPFCCTLPSVTLAVYAMTYCGFLVPPPDCPPPLPAPPLPPVSELNVEEEEEVLVPPPVELAEADEFD